MNQYSRSKKILYSIIMIFCSVLAVEVMLHILYIILKHQLFPFSTYDEMIRLKAESVKYHSTKDELVAGEIDRGNSVIQVIHPYLGYVLDPKRTPDTSYLGLPNEKDDPLSGKDNGSITVAIFGGSFAAGTASYGATVMHDILQSNGKIPQILTIAMGGYKQPQQLFALAYLLSHGAKFDVVVNIDGFNEVALPKVENIPFGVNPFYPRAWYNRTYMMQDQATLRQMGRSLTFQDSRQQWAMLFLNMPKFSIIRNIGWRAYDNVLQRKIKDIDDQILHPAKEKEDRFLATGPKIEFKRETELYQAIADHWKSCSLLMKALCDSQGIEYIHFIQPNQYFEAGRKLTETEQQNCFREDHPYRPGVENGYPKLLEAKNDLINSGVNFHDLTMIFHDIPQTVYKDDCCHPNSFGYDIIAKYIAQNILKVIGAQPVLQGN